VPFGFVITVLSLCLNPGVTFANSALLFFFVFCTVTTCKLHLSTSFNNEGYDSYYNKIRICT